MAGLQVELGYVELKVEHDLAEPLVEHGFEPEPWTEAWTESWTESWTEAWTEDGSEAEPSTEDEFEHGP